MNGLKSIKKAGLEMKVAVKKVNGKEQFLGGVMKWGPLFNTTAKVVKTVKTAKTV